MHVYQITAKVPFFEVWLTNKINIDTAYKNLKMTDLLTAFDPFSWFYGDNWAQ